MRFVERLPDAAEIRLAVGSALNGSGLRWLTAGARHHRHGDESADCRASEGHSNGRTSEVTCHEALLPCQTIRFLASTLSSHRAWELAIIAANGGGADL